MAKETANTLTSTAQIIPAGVIQLRRMKDKFVPTLAESFRVSNVPFEPEITFKNLGEALLKAPETIELIPVRDRANLFITLGEMHGAAFDQRIDRIYGSQSSLLFDIDNVEDAGATLTTPPANWQDYLDAFEKVTRLKKGQYWANFTGHGYHIILLLTQKLDAEFFKTNKHQYTILASLLNDAFHDANLKGFSDTQPFAPNYMTRLPGSINNKEGKELRHVIALTHTIPERITLDLEEMSGVKKLKPQDFVPEKEMQSIKIDAASMEGGCEFLKWAKDKPAALTEPQWRAALSLLARLPDAESKAIEYSRGGNGFTEEKTLQKLKQVKQWAYSCTKIDECWSNCSTCKYQNKVYSPVQIKSETFIATEETGFFLTVMVDNKPKKKAAIDDLIKYFNRINPTIYVSEHDSLYTYNGTHWEKYSDDLATNFARTHIKMEEMHSSIPLEFKNRLHQYNVKTQKFFENNVSKLNLRNGVFDMNTGELLPHAQDFGFRYTADFDYEPNAPSPILDTFIEQISQNDMQVRHRIQETCGYVVSECEAKAGKIIYAYGPKAGNGKTTLFEKILPAFLDGRIAPMTAENMLKEHIQAEIDNSAMVYFDEFPKRTKTECWQAINTWSTGGTIMAARKYERPANILIKAKVVISSNKLPATGADLSNDAMFRRLLFIPFFGVFREELGNMNEDIHNQILATEKAGFLNFCYQGYQRGLANGKGLSFRFSACDKGDAILNQVKEFSDPVKEFLSQNFTIASGHEIPNSGKFIIRGRDERPHVSLTLAFVSFGNSRKAEGHTGAFSMAEFSERFRDWFSSQLKSQRMWERLGSDTWHTEIEGQKYELCRKSLGSDYHWLCDALLPGGEEL